MAQELFQNRRKSLITIMVLLPLLAGILVAAQTTCKIKNRLDEDIVVTIHCSDQSSCDVAVEDGENVKVYLPADVIAVEVEDVFVMPGTSEIVTLQSGTVIEVDFTRTHYIAIVEDDIGD